MLSGNNDLCSHVKVVVRVRPENEREKEGNYSSVVQVVDGHMLVFDPKEEELHFYQGQVSKYQDINKRKKKDLKFVFDRVFDENATHLEVFESTTKTILDGVLNGYNCSVLAYGATGAGKTYTMVGSPEDPGVMYQTMMDLYKRIEEIKEEKLCSVAVSYLEVYNEQIRDLLTCCGPLALREDAQKGVMVQGLTLHQPKCAQHILEMLDYGNKNRTQHPTDMNASSSRSHAVFQIYLRQQDKIASISRNVRIAKMCLIDLAGSERVSATNAKGARLREGANINRSLLALGNIINALSDPKCKKHIPYRNSKLTRLLKDSLGGNCQTVMIAAVSPSSLSYDDTYNTLKYANRAKDIKASLKSNVLNLDSHITQYAKICEQQRKEILMLKEKLQAYEEKMLNVDKNPVVNLAGVNSQQEAEFKRFRETLKQVFTARAEIKKNYLDLEKQLKVNELKAQHQEEHHHQIHLLCSEERVGKATCKRERTLASLKVHNVHTEKKKQGVAEHLAENSNWLHKVENEMHLLGQDGQIPEVLQKELQCQYLQLEIQDIKQQMEDTVQLVTLQEQEKKRTTKILNRILPVLKQQYYNLKEARLTNGTTESQFREVEHLIQREKGVIWADQIAAKENTKHFPHALSSVASYPYLQCSESSSDSSMDKENVQAVPVERSKEHPVAMLKSPVLQSKENVQSAANDEIYQHKPARRKLMDSPLDRYNPKVISSSSVSVLNDSFSKEGFFPIQYTPDGCQMLTVQNHCKQTVEFKASGPCQRKDFGHERNTSVDSDCASGMNLKDITLILTECRMNSTFILSPGAQHKNCDTDTELTKETSQPHGNKGRALQRCVLPDTVPSISLPPMPSYMAMTSAAQGKRKLLRDDLQNAVGPKRIRQDVWPGCKPLRVLKKGTNGSRHKQENERPKNTQLGRTMFWRATKSEFSRNFSNRY